MSSRFLTPTEFHTVIFGLETFESYFHVGDVIVRNDHFLLGEILEKNLPETPFLAVMTLFEMFEV